MLSVRGLTVSFRMREGLQPAVRDVDLDLHPGRVLAVVGESGSGKSVTAMAVLGLLPRNAHVGGSIRLAGRELVGATGRQLRDVRGGQVAMVFQEPTTALNPVLTVGAQLGETLRAHRRTTRAEAAGRGRDLLASTGLHDPDRIAAAYPHELSGGQLQRAMIAMGISCDPAVLIADEPTTALDVTVQAGILELLRDLAVRSHTAVLLITHDMGVVADLADDVLVLHRGQVVERAPAGRLFAGPRHPATTGLLAAVPALPELDLTLALDEPGSDDDGTDGDATGGDATGDARPGGAGSVVRVRDALVTYPGRGGRPDVSAVDGVDLHIDAGEVLGLVGESGSGKSTLGRALAGLVPVASGEVTVAGVDVAGASRHPGRRNGPLRAVRARLGIVFQDPASSLNPRHTIGEVVAEPLRLHTELRGARLRDRVAELLETVQLPPDHARRHPHELSGGQRQRVAVARALALDPVLLIADEPTSALDATVQATVLDLLRTLQRRSGFACLFITHDLGVIQQLADRVAVMRRGEVVETGRTDRILRAPRHPYTQQLLASAPVADPGRQRRRRAALHHVLTRQPTVV